MIVKGWIEALIISSEGVHGRLTVSSASQPRRRKSRQYEWPRLMIEMVEGKRCVGSCCAQRPQSWNGLTRKSRLRREIRETFKGSHELRTQNSGATEGYEEGEVLSGKHLYTKTKNFELEPVCNLAAVCHFQAPFCSQAESSELSCYSGGLSPLHSPQLLPLCIKRGFLGHLIFLLHLTRFTPKEWFWWHAVNASVVRDSCIMRLWCVCPLFLFVPS